MRLEFSILFILLLLISCQENSIALDFTNLEFPEADTTKTASLDSIITTHEKYVSMSESEGIYCYTDKTKYAPGEPITLTIENKSENITEFLYPGEVEANRQLALIEMMNISNDSLKMELDKVLISKAPAIKGQVSPSGQNAVFVYLLIDAVDQYSAEKMGYNHFEKVLEPGEKIVYHVTLPKRIGYYSFLFVRHSYDINNPKIWGFNKFIYSNAFEITN